MFTGDCCSNTCPLSTSQNVYHDNNMPKNKTVHVIDNELRLRSLTNNINCNHSIPNSTTSINIGRFDELTNFFNIINGLFHQSAFTLGLSTYHLAPLFYLPEMNVGVNIHIDQQSLEQHKIDLLRNMTLYSLIGGNETDAIVNKPMGIIKFHTSDQNLMLSVNHRWTPSLTTTFRLRTTPQKKLWSHLEYRRPNETYELIGEYGTRHSSSIKFSYLSCLWKRFNYQIDGGIDLRITTREKLADIGLRLKNSSHSIVFKCDLYHPFEHYLIGIQRCMNTNFTVGLLAEKITNSSQQQPIKFSLMSQWYLTKPNLRINTLVNTQNELGLALTHNIRHFPLVLQTFGLYSLTTRKCKWGIGIQLLL